MTQSMRSKEIGSQDRLGRGFTLIEILVVVFIIGLLVALTIPAVLMSRDAGRRSQCANNLHQLGLGLESYVSVMGSLPPAGNSQGFSVIVRLLPYLEATTIYNAINFPQGASDIESGSTNRTIFSTRLNLLLCPSEVTSTGNSGGGTNYAGNNGVNRRDGAENNGAFSLVTREPIRLADFTDGTSQTAAMSEWVRGPIAMNARDEKGSIFATPSYLTGPGTFEPFNSECMNLNPTTASINLNDKGENWLHGGYGHTLYNHNLSMNSHSCKSEGIVQEGAYSAGSRHPHGGNTLFVDGHVRFIADTITVDLWRGLGTRNGGEVLGSTVY